MTKHRHIWISTRTTGAERSGPDLLQRPRDGNPIGAGSRRRFSYLLRSGPSVPKRGVHSLVARCVWLLRGGTTSVARLGDARIDLCASTHRRRQAAAVSGNAPCQCAHVYGPSVWCPGGRPQLPHGPRMACPLHRKISRLFNIPTGLWHHTASVSRDRFMFAAATPNPQAGFYSIMPGR